MNIYRAERNRKLETGQGSRDWRPSEREQQILSTVQRRTQQGVSADKQYSDLSKAREKRKQRRERNMKTLLAGGYKQVILLP